MMYTHLVQSMEVSYFWCWIQNVPMVYIFFKLLFPRKAFEIPAQRYSKFKKFMNTPASFDGDSKPKLYLKLSRKEHSSLYSKGEHILHIRFKRGQWEKLMRTLYFFFADDIWVVSKTLNFDPIDTFIASSAFFGPSSNNEIELLPLKGYSPSNWRSNSEFHSSIQNCGKQLRTKPASNEGWVWNFSDLAHDLIHSTFFPCMLEYIIWIR